MTDKIYKTQKELIDQIKEDNEEDVTVCTESGLVFHNKGYLIDIL